MCRGRVFCESWANGTAPLWGAVLRPSDYVSEAESELESRPAFLNSRVAGGTIATQTDVLLPFGEEEGVRRRCQRPPQSGLSLAFWGCV